MSIKAFVNKLGLFLDQKRDPTYEEPLMSTESTPATPVAKRKRDLTRVMHNIPEDFKLLGAAERAYVMTKLKEIESGATPSAPVVPTSEPQA